VRVVISEVDVRGLILAVYGQAQPATTHRADLTQSPVTTSQIPATSASVNQASYYILHYPPAIIHPSIYYA